MPPSVPAAPRAPLPSQPTQSSQEWRTAALAEETAAPTSSTDPTTTAPATTPPTPTTVLTPEPTATATDAPATATESPATSAPTTTAPAVPAAPTTSADAQPAVTLPGADYGTGKLYPELQAPQGSGIDSEEIDPTGAQVTLTYSTLSGAPSTAEATCTFEAYGCVFPSSSTIPKSIINSDLAYIPANSVYTLTLVQGPDSGHVLLLPGATVSTQGHSSVGTGSIDPVFGSENPFSSVTVPLVAPHGYRQIGISGGPAGEEFRLCTVADWNCVYEDDGDPDGDVLTLASVDEDSFTTVTTDGSGNATFSGIYQPGTYTLFRSSAPTVPLTLEVGIATSLPERDTPVRLALGTPVTTPAPPTTSAPVTNTPAAGTPAAKSVAVASIAPGKTQTISIGGFQPNERVHGVLHSTPVDLGTVQADGNGVATFTFAVPAGFEAGTHTVEMTGLTSGITAEATFTVTAASSTSGGGLAYTGTDVLPLLAVGGGLLAAGAAAVTVAARRRSA
ncbi:hypothetical protein [Modestobacter altitudinis]|uniref:hypothetical protein n=1 Tax=Modestobacter altitudinis TaxID=2213158 RepID=UPI00110CE0A3|nr:hypothetical protein [Modestobacter altitudinis]